METLGIILFLASGAIVVAEAVLVFRFVFVVATARPRLCSTDECPKTAVILCLRGTDPFLESCIHAILNQDYPDFELRIVVDHDSDPAWDVVRPILDRTTSSSVVATSLDDRADSCSLKCSSIVQAVRALDTSVEVIALIDADTIAHPTWLRELVAPMVDPRVAVTTGNRWYMPDRANPGAIIRHAWNVGAVVVMHWFRIGWGGTLAIKRSAIEKAGLLSRWESAFCEDTMLFGVLKEHGLRQVFVPTLIMINRESCTLPEFRGWVSRQLLTARLYHRGWRATIAHGLLSAAIVLPTLALLAAAIIRYDAPTAAISLSGIVMFEGALVVLYAICEMAVRRVARQRNENTRWITPRAVAVLPAVFVVTQVVYFFALVRAMFMKSVEWRGIRYRIDGPWKIRVEKHTHFARSRTTAPGRSL